MKYILEAESEFERLEKQSKHPNYDPHSEFGDLSDLKHARILDAGCGSGLVCRYFAARFPEATIIGCDLSEQRIQLARRAAAAYENISFQTEDLAHLTFGYSQFDAIVCRYVLQHLDPAARGQVLAEFYRVLKPGGKIYVIDYDGFFLNLYPQTPLLSEVFECLDLGGFVDFTAGRKVPSLLNGAGFERLNWRIDTANCRGDSGEVEVMRERFEHLLPTLATFLGSQDKAQAFVAEFLTVLRRPETVYFQNKFIVSGMKPPMSLSLIK